MRRQKSSAKPNKRHGKVHKAGRALQLSFRYAIYTDKGGDVWIEFPNVWFLCPDRYLDDIKAQIQTFKELSAKLLSEVSWHDGERPPIVKYKTRLSKGRRVGIEGYYEALSTGR